ncbi:GNAT family N-acetyltransferase [Streptomyces sp. NPDC048639]|uniref:GNAT family N-acetyltransferase n=1 Tax=Streptomyces sp. NPDC048639 TaxID=3365581 RepID=UPI00371D0D8B
MFHRMQPGRPHGQVGSEPSGPSGTTVRELGGGVRVITHPQLTPTLESEMVGTWVEVTNRGGAGIGFLPPVSAQDVEPASAELVKKVRNDAARLVVVQRDSTLLGWLAVVLNRDHTQSHWAWLKRMHVIPEGRSAGIGTAMLDAAVDLCVAEGLRQLYLTTDGQTGPVGFYGKRGFVEVGRMPRNTLAADGNLHDEVYMMREFEVADSS